MSTQCLAFPFKLVYLPMMHEWETHRLCSINTKGLVENWFNWCDDRNSLVSRSPLSRTRFGGVKTGLIRFLSQHFSLITPWTTTHWTLKILIDPNMIYIFPSKTIQINLLSRPKPYFEHRYNPCSLSWCWKEDKFLIYFKWKNLQ